MAFAVSSALATSSPSGMSAAIAALAASLPRGGVAEMPLLFGDLEYRNQLWYSLPELFRFFVSGNLGNMCFFLIERGLYTFIERIPSPPTFLMEHHDSASFIVGYILQIVTQHLLHAWLVYGLNTINSRDKYLRTLGGQASAYFTALIGSTVLNIFLRKRGMSKNTAFVTTLYLFACINYFVIGWITRRSVGTDAVPEQSSLHVGIVTEATCSSSFSLVLGQEKAIRRGGACDTARQATSFQQNTGADGIWPVRTMITESQQGRRLDSDLLCSQQMPSTFKKFS
jgi:hypothetical protein